METFDFIIIGLGIALIAIGLFLFISGKRDSENSNQVEGFGIKLNISNPSIILIVFGIGLVVFPRLMSNGGPVQEIINNPLPNLIEQIEPTPQSSTVNSNVIKPAVTKSKPNPTPQFSEKPSAPSAFFPRGTWYLSQYHENGVDLSGNIEGSIRFNQRNENSSDWYADMVAVDGWGNVMNYYYNGIINAFPGGYDIDTQSSNDPTFSRQGSTRLVMQMDNPNSLHMEYMFNGSLIILHWAQ